MMQKRSDSPPEDASEGHEPLSRSIAEVKADLFKALAHPARIQVLELLASGERSVSEIQPFVGLEPSHLSQQLGVLRRAGVVSTRKDGPLVIYSIRDPQLVELLALAKQMLIRSLAQSQDLLAGLRATPA